MLELSATSKTWLENAKQQSDHIDLDLLSRACVFTENLNEKVTPRFATSVLDQGLEMAKQLLEFHVDNETLAAAIAYPAVYYGNVSRVVIEKQLGKNIYKMLKSAQHIEAIQPMAQITSSKRADNLRKMILAIIDDVRIVLIKLSECLVILKFLRKHDTEERKAIAQQTIDLYSPLANRLGIGQLKWQLEDLAFRFLNEKEYMEIKKALKMRRDDRERYISIIVRQLTELLNKEGIKASSISGRAKHIFSIHRKMQQKHLSFEQLYDTIAFRILVPEVADCYTALSIVHAQWPHIQSEFDDYIMKPKPNGYQSIHTAVAGPHNINIEIQIRTQKMHEDAELGVAAHWKYKEGGKQSRYEEKINRLREIMSWQRDTANQDDSENLYSKVFEDQVYVFTPNGDVFDLPTGATPLDFAYMLHTDVGHRCRGAKVNDVLVPLTYKLKTGDCVDITTAKESKPSRDWLNPASGYLATQNARAKVRHWFKKQNFERDLEEGTAIWEKHYRREGLKKSDINKAYQRFNFKNPENLLAAIGSNDIGIATVIHYLTGDTPSIVEKSADITTSKQATIEKTAKQGLVIEGVGNLLTSIAKCCKPIPGDPIIAYVTKGRGVTIHHQQCQNIKQAIQYRPERILEVHWASQQAESYPVNIAIEADDCAGLLRDVSAAITNEKIAIIGIQSHVDTLKDRAYINITVEVSSLSLLNKLMTQLRALTAVISVKRV